MPLQINITIQKYIFIRSDYTLKKNPCSLTFFYISDSICNLLLLQFAQTHFRLFDNRKFPDAAFLKGQLFYYSTLVLKYKAELLFNENPVYMKPGTTWGMFF